MLRTSLRQATLTSFALGSLLQAACTQAATPAAPGQPDLQGLPTFLLPVPGGTVQVGITAKQLVESASETVSPYKPANAIKQVDKFTTAMKRTVSSMGQEKISVEPFLLGKWNVKCSEYEAYVIHKRALKLKIRPPFIWWRYGDKKNYESKLEDIARQFPKDPNGAVLYWERFGDELPYALLDERGQSIADTPVSHVSYRDAVEFAGWLGMRLPNEYEWTRAARGDGTYLWPWGVSQADHYSEACLAFLGIDKSAGQRPVAAGSIANAAGPFGHQDMFGRIWQIMAEIGYRPINGEKTFQSEWAALQKDKVGSLLTAPASWKGDRCVAKGGSYLSSGEPIQLLIDTRAPMLMTDVLEGAGFRLAKSMKPGFDMLYSLVRGQYNRGAFASDQNLDEAAQVGAERYELGANGFPTAYHAVSFMPVQWLTNEKSGELAKLLERSQAQPILIGTFATTEAMTGPDVPAGLYTVLYRKEGIPKELVEAMKQGHKEVLAALKAKSKGGEEKPEKDKPENDKEAKKGSWREICARFGITEADLESKDAANGLKFVRIDGTQVPFDNDCFLLVSSVEGKVVAVVPATNHHPANGTAFASSLTFEKGQKVKSTVRFRIGIPVKPTEPKRIAEFHFQVNLDCEAPSAEVVWRLPSAAGTAIAPGSSGIQKTTNNTPK